MTWTPFVPLPLQVVIDDVGWRRGQDGSAARQPYRTGIDRLHGLEDYQAIASLGQRLNIRPQAAMILSEWDTRNRVASVPSASWMGSAWDNSAVAGPWIEPCAQFIRDHRDHFEVTLHGIGHEFWDADGRMSRAEWHDVHGNLRPVETIRAKLELFLELHEQHRLGPTPRSFVPCAFLHHFGRPGENLAQILRGYGITSLSIPFCYMHRTEQPKYAWFGLDHGLMTVDRDRDLTPWYMLAPDPRPDKLPPGPIVGMHWPNLLHHDPARNGEVVDRWARVLEIWGQLPTRMLAPHTEAFCAQLAHHDVTRVERRADDTIHIDARPFFALPWAAVPTTAPLVLKIRSDAPLAIEPIGHSPRPRATAAPNGLHVIDVPLSRDRPETALSVRVG